MINPQRVKKIYDGKKKSGPVIYWMQREQRVNDNWGLITAQLSALKKDQPLIVVFCLVNNFLDAAFRQYDFMIKGLIEVEKKLQELNIPFILLTGNPSEKIPEFVDKVGASVLVSDSNPLRIINKWKQSVIKKINIPFYEVDGHNIVPCSVASPKLEFAAYTIRPKINKLLHDFLDEFIPLQKMGSNNFSDQKNNWDEVYKNLNINFNVKPVNWLIPGEDSAQKVFNEFLDNRFEFYATGRNDPNKNAVSHLSPFLHFGQISAQRIALEVNKINGNEESKKSFLEELIIRRELSDNFCFYNPHYDSFEGFPEWAKKTLNEHRDDVREFIYSKEEFENAKTHDDLWNAAQLEMVNSGKMHGYMRMYWAKKILEWTNSPEEALAIAIYLNDKYELDGRDPNGYVGVAWSIGGVHDRAWTERPVFGKIRFMNYNGCTRKFDVANYINNNLIYK